MTKSKIKVLTVGVFDLFHVGHINLFENAKKYGDFLIVAVQDNIERYKPGIKLYYSFEERMKIVNNIRIVDKVIKYLDVDVIVKKIKFDVFAKGPDQNHQGFQNAVEYCHKNHIKVVEIPRTQGVSSTAVRKKLYS